ncbi:hypothetical protein [Legionella oakridgensis]|uniref:hypothetical protein n=1 Tax=Legionella oakridgensis TaxID=29423 RepID=UPI0003DE45DE|nr:hypothetical protein [Legionella oakridgensis]ETO92349.1 hypothetical protein LOR_64c17910 [Legionella oakridgensis RV-2-2007]
MIVLSRDESDNLKAIILNYLQGEPLRVVRVRLETECEELKTGCKTLYKAIELKSKDDPFVLAILNSLNIKKATPGSKAGEYEKVLQKSENLYELLSNLYHDGYHHIGYLLRLIENTTPKRNWALIFTIGAFLSAGIGVFFYFNKKYFDAFTNWLSRSFPFVIDWCGKTFSLLKNIPLLGMVYNGLGLLFSWYNTFSNGTTTASHKLNSLFFKTLTASLNITAYFLSYTAGGAMMLPAAVLFVLSSSIDVFKSVYDFFKTRHALKTLKTPDEYERSWEQLAEYERAKNLHKRSMKSVWIKFTAAVLTTIAIGIWSFFPPNLIIMIGCIAFISLISLAKKSVLDAIYEQQAQQLQKKLQHIETTYHVELDPANQSSFVKLKQKRQHLDQHEVELARREAALAKKEKEIAIRQQAILDSDESSPVKMLRSLKPQSQQEEYPSRFLVEHTSDFTVPLAKRLRKTRSYDDLYRLKEEERTSLTLG